MNTETHTSATATLRIFSIEMSPEEITAILGLSPKRTHRIGERKSAKNPRSATHEANVWLYGFQEGCSMNELLVRVGRMVEQHEIHLNVLAEKCEFDIFCGYFPEDSQGGFSIQHDTLVNIGRIPANLIFDVYAETAT